MKINVDKVVAVFAGLASAVLPVLVHDGVLTSQLAADIGSAVATFLLGYHLPPGEVFPRPAGSAPEPVPAAETPAPEGPQIEAPAA